MRQNSRNTAVAGLAIVLTMFLASDQLRGQDRSSAIQVVRFGVRDAQPQNSIRPQLQSSNYTNSATADGIPSVKLQKLTISVIPITSQGASRQNRENSFTTPSRTPASSIAESAFSEVLHIDVRALSETGLVPGSNTSRQVITVTD